MNYYDFATRYRIQNIRAVNRFENIQTYTSTHQMYRDQDSLIEMEMPRASFEALVNSSNSHDAVLDREWKEERLRRQYPDVAEAYNRYRVLLELVK